MNKYVIDEEKRLQLGKFIKEKREEKGFGMNQLAAKISVTNSLIHRLENGQTQKISPFLLKEIAGGLRIDYKELYRIVGYLEEEEELKTVSNIQILDVELEAIPLFDSISAGCGNDPAEIVDHIVLPGKKGTNYFAVKVVGDSMEPRIPNNSILVVKRDEIAENGRVGAFIISDGAVVKRIHRNKTTTMLLSDNTSYPPIVISEGDTYHECGKVVQVLLPEGEI